jgi:hypothetical protein
MLTFELTEVNTVSEPDGLSQPGWRQQHGSIVLNQAARTPDRDYSRGLLFPGQFQRVLVKAYVHRPRYGPAGKKGFECHKRIENTAIQCPPDLAMSS